MGKTILCLVTAYRLEGNKEKTLREALKGVWEDERLLIYEHSNEHFLCKRTSMALYTYVYLVHGYYSRNLKFELLLEFT